MGASGDTELGSSGKEEEARVSEPPRSHKEFPVSRASHFVPCLFWVFFFPPAPRASLSTLALSAPPGGS